MFPLLRSLCGLSLLLALAGCTRGSGTFHPGTDGGSPDGRIGSIGDIDGDGVPDATDNDIDNDGLSNEEEMSRYFTDPRNEDSDGDGYSDAAEIATGHDPIDASNTLSASDYYLLLPRGSSEDRDLEFSTTLQKADVFFMMDRTSSMGDEASNLRSGLLTLVDRLTNTIEDVGVGFGGFSGFPAGNCMNSFGMVLCDYGDEEDRPFILSSIITTDRTVMQTAVNGLRADLGGAFWAPSTEAIYQAATGDGIGTWVAPQTCEPVLDEEGTRVGYPCFRPGALPIMVVLTDTSDRGGPFVDAEDRYVESEFRGTPPHTYEETINAVNAIGGRVFGVISGMEITSPLPRTQFESWARDTGTVDADGNPILFQIGTDGSGLTTSVAEAIESLASETPQTISTRVRDGDDLPVVTPAIDARGFIKSITPQAAYRDGVELTADEVPRTDRIFERVVPGTRVKFRIHFQNDFVDARETSEILHATISVIGNGVAELDTHDVIIIVPAGSIVY